MNLIPISISLVIALVASLYYLQGAKEDSEVLNYRRAIIEFEAAVDDLVGIPLSSNLVHTSMSDSEQLTHCNKLNKDFLQRLPAGTQWDISVQGLDCDIAILMLSPPASSLVSVGKALAASNSPSATMDYTSNTVNGLSV